MMMRSTKQIPSPAHQQTLKNNAVAAASVRQHRMMVAMMMAMMMMMIGYTLQSNGTTFRIATSIGSSNRDRCADGSCDVASRDSFGFFDDIPDDIWAHKKFITTKLSGGWYEYPDNPSNFNDRAKPHWMAFNVHPMFTCDYLTRVGGHGDGGKWICDIHRFAKKPDCLVYSIGSNGQYEFEEGIQELAYQSLLRPWDPHYHPTEQISRYPCEIHIFDPSPKYTASAAKNMYYHPWGIKSNQPSHLMDKADRTELQFMTLEETFAKLNHTQRHIDVFKIDCEGCEWTAYPDIMKHSHRMTQILMEIHPSTGRSKDLMFPTYFEEFRKHHWIPYYREPNPWKVEVHEYSFIRLQNFYPDIDKKL